MDKTKSDKVLKRKRRIKLVIKPDEVFPKSKMLENYIALKGKSNLSHNDRVSGRSLSPAMAPSRIIKAQHSNAIIAQNKTEIIKKYSNQALTKENFRMHLEMPRPSKSGLLPKPLNINQYSQSNSKNLSPLRLVTRPSVIKERNFKSIKENFNIDLNSFRKILGEAPSWTNREEIPYTTERKIKKSRKVSFELKGWD
ncbi:hypothetical protein SteCoe_25171 [Stentor coeruleus]|uniref:Uncharacterized protein n=1 Tax=Stentor coeruleus TaxID=5963 RepID=A0A1R2BFU7_9CILI|nr:hypothetical protein SteCoe_25171 [Stentor coeruleus]